jgi:hypothetical protein
MSSSAEPLCLSQMEFASLRPAVCLLGRSGRDFSLFLIAFSPLSSHLSYLPKEQQDLKYCAIHSLALSHYTASDGGVERLPQT